MENRKGALKAADIPAAVLARLNEGILASVNLTEWLAVDHRQLLQQVLPKTYTRPVLDALSLLKEPSTMQMIRSIGTTLLYESRVQKDDQLLPLLSTHPSDSVRCWAAYITGQNELLNISQKLEAIRPFASDAHFGVRELAWMVVRPDVDTHLQEAIAFLTPWTKEKDTNLRRFASEVTRPRGVWCKHIDALKDNPAQALPILEALNTDPEKYVQDSVANWLNDASKTQPEWVQQTCDNWNQHPGGKITARITDKALRTLRKNAQA